MSEKFDSGLTELLNEIQEAAVRAQPEDARSALLYCLKQLKISAAARSEH